MSDKTPVPNLLPYPLGTDAVADGDDTMRALAQRVDLRLGKWASWASAPTNMTVPAGKAVESAWLRTSEWIHCRIQMPIQTVTGKVVFTLPVAADSWFATPLITPLGRAVGNRVGSRYHFGDIVFEAVDKISVLDPGSTPNNPWTGSSPVAWQPNDTWTLVFGYRPGVQN